MKFYENPEELRKALVDEYIENPPTKPNGHASTEDALISQNGTDTRPPDDPEEELPAKIPAGPTGLVCFRNTDVGNGQRLIHLYGSRLRYFHPWKKWLVWDGKRWKFDDTGGAMRLAKAMVSKLFKVALALTDSDARDRLLKFASNSEKSARIEAMLSMASSVKKITVVMKDLDAHPLLLNLNNGTLNLKTGELQPHDERDHLTKLAPIDFDANAQCPLWLKFQEAVTCGDAELLEFKQRILGYGLTGDISSKRSLFIYHGAHDTGKTTETELYRDLLGDYATQIPIQSLMEHKHSRTGAGPSPDIADLRGSRLVVSSEPGEGQKLAVSMLKWLTGRGRVKGRGLHEGFCEFQQTWKIILDCNDKPEVAGHDVWNRIGLLPFAMKSLAEEDQDEDLPKKLRAELPGILNWAVEGYRSLQREGLRMPQSVAAATETYRLENDQIARFIEEVCNVDERFSVLATPLYAKYQDWCKKAGQDHVNSTVFGNYPWSSKRISKRRETAGVKYHGIAIKHEQNVGL